MADDIDLSELEESELSQEELEKAAPKEVPKEVPKKELEVHLPEVIDLKNDITVSFANIESTLSEAYEAKVEEGKVAPSLLNGEIIFSNKDVLSTGKVQQSYPIKVWVTARGKKGTGIDVEVEPDGILIFLDRLQDAYSRQIPNSALSNFLEYIYNYIVVQLKKIPNLKTLEFKKLEVTPSVKETLAPDVWQKIHERAEEASKKFLKQKEESEKELKPERRTGSPLKRLDEFFRSQKFTWDKEKKDYYLFLSKGQYEPIKDIIDLGTRGSTDDFSYTKSENGDITVIWHIPLFVKEYIQKKYGNNMNKFKILSYKELETTEQYWAGPSLEHIGHLIGMPQANRASELAADLASLLPDIFPKFPPPSLSTSKTAAIKDFDINTLPALKHILDISEDDLYNEIKSHPFKSKDHNELYELYKQMVNEAADELNRIILVDLYEDAFKKAKRAFDRFAQEEKIRWPMGENVWKSVGPEPAWLEGVS